MRSDGSIPVPAAIWHEGFDWRLAPWCDFATGEPLSDLHTGFRAVGEQHRVKTYTEVIRRHFLAVPERVLTASGESPRLRSNGVLVPSPTEVSTVRLIGREMNALDRAGVTQNPEYSDYTSDAERQRLALAVLRHARAPTIARLSGLPARTVRSFLATGSTSKARWKGYEAAATQIASKALASLSRALPSNEEDRWRLYVNEGRRCRCGVVLKGKQRKWCVTCRRLGGEARRAMARHAT